MQWQNKDPPIFHPKENIYFLEVLTTEISNLINILYSVALNQNTDQCTWLWEHWSTLSLVDHEIIINLLIAIKVSVSMSW